MNDELNIDTTVFDEEYEQQQLDKALRQGEIDRAAAEAEQEAPAKAEPPEQKKEKKGEFLGGMMNQLDNLGVQNPAEVDNINDMGGKSRSVAGAVDAVMDLTSKFLPFMKDPADWWDEVSGRKTETDPLKKAERDAAAVIMPMLFGGGVIGAGTKAAGLTGKTKLLTDSALNLGLDAVISGTSDTTSEAGNLGSLFESGIKQIVPGAYIPWASRDGESPDVIYWKNMTENMVLGSVDPIVTAIYGVRAGNKLVPKNDIAKTLIEAKPEKPSTVQDAILRNRAKKQAEQLKLGRRVLEADPEGTQGYNAFVNEPAEPQARITLDEEANAVDFMTDQARIQNNVNTQNGRARPILDNDTQDILSKADAVTRANILGKVETDLRAEFDVIVGGQKLSAREVQQSINNLYDAAIAPIGGSFNDAIKDFRDLELKVGNMTDTVTSRGGRKVIGKTVERLVDAMSPYKQRASAVIQTQTAAGVSDIARNTDLMEPVVDTSRLQELMMPRLRTLLKEQATSQIAETQSTILQKRLAKKVSTMEGALAFDEGKEFNDMFDLYTKTVEEKSQLIDEFVDQLTEMARQNPSFLRPVYRLYAKTSGEVDSMYKLNEYLGNRLGMLRKSMYDEAPEVPSLILREMQAMRTANMINGTAPATAWIGNLAAVSVRPLTSLSGAVALGVKTGKFKTLQRSLVAFGQLQETLRRASKMARDEWKYAWQNPEAAMKRGRADYDFSDANTGWKQTLADFEEMEELYETMSPGRKALWNLTKSLSTWNKKSFNKWGVHAMYSADGFVKSMMASLDSRYKAYDAAVMKNNGVFDKNTFRQLEQSFYDEAFDADGMIKDGYAKFASEEIALNAENPLIERLEHLMDTFPIMKSIFTFARTKANAISVVQTFDPTGATALWRDKSWKTMTADVSDSRAIREVLDMHGMKGGSLDDFRMLQSEYIGRKLFTSGIVATAAMATVAGQMTGSGAWMTPADKQRAIQGGWKPYTIYGRPYEKAPDWMRLTMSLISDITMAHISMEGNTVESWFGAMSDVMSANINNEMFGTEVESLGEIINMGPNAIARYGSGLVDTLIPGAGVRSALNDALMPQLQDVENNFFAYLANRNRFVTHPLLEEAVDPFTGQPINGARYPLEKLIGRLIPFWETAGGDEPWRKWMMSTGWTGLSKIEKNPFTGEDIKPYERQWINRWIGENGNWDKEMEQYMKWDDGKFEREWRKLPGHKRAELPIGKTYIHEWLNESKKRQFNAAWAAFIEAHPKQEYLPDYRSARDAALGEGEFEEASGIQDTLNIYK